MPDTCCSPRSVGTTRKSSADEVVLLPTHQSPPISAYRRSHFDTGFQRSSITYNLFDDAASSIYSDDESVIIALDAYELPKPLRLSKAPSCVLENPQRNLPHVGRLQASSSLRKSHSWADLDSTNAGSNGEDIGRARFRLRWEERLARKGTVTEITSLAGKSGYGPATGPITAPAIVTKKADIHVTSYCQAEDEVLVDEPEQLLEEMLKPIEEQAWLDAEWKDGHIDESASGQRRIVRKESIWLKQQRQRDDVSQENIA